MTMSGLDPVGGDTTAGTVGDAGNLGDVTQSDPVLTARLAELHARLAELPGLLVAFSGGADSAFLLAAAVRVGNTRLIDNVVLEGDPS